MKIRKNIILVAGILAIGAISIGANANGDNRPPGVAAEQWIVISDKAGFALTSESNPAIFSAELYVKIEKTWRRARIENPVAAIPLQR